MHRIMLVDDDVDFVNMTRRVLEAAGYQVSCAHDCANVIDLLDKENFDLLITDLMMNCLDSGFSLAKDIRSNEKLRNLPIILVTSVSSTSGLDFHPQNADDLQQMQVNAFFSKPVASKQLLETVKQLIEGAK